MPGKLMNLCTDFDSLSRRIRQETNSAWREWEKVKILSQQQDYLDFLCYLTQVERATVVRTLNEFAADESFRHEFGANLQEFEAATTLVHGDVRFHSLTLYTVIRLCRPQLVIETGVASGKSSAVVLLGLHHNHLGKLISIDLPNSPGHILPDGSLTHTGAKPTGWLVPQYLHQRWELLIGDSREVLPEVVQEASQVDIFFHDSLHTYDHVKFELGTVTPKLKLNSVVLVDNVDMPGGQAFEEFVALHQAEGYRFRDFGGCRFLTAPGQ